MIPGDVESCSDNYIAGDAGNVLKPLKELRASAFPVYVGMKAFLTKTLRKDIDFINGMRVTVKGWDSVTRAVRVETSTGRTISITQWSDPAFGDMMYYPLRVGYASTVLRMAGAELRHVTLYLDVPNVPAAAYTALSRVATLDQVKIGGAFTKAHFTPARV